MSIKGCLFSATLLVAIDLHAASIFVGPDIRIGCDALGDNQTANDPFAITDLANLPPIDVDFADINWAHWLVVGTGPNSYLQSGTSATDLGTPGAPASTVQVKLYDHIHTGTPPNPQPAMSDKITIEIRAFAGISGSSYQWGTPANRTDALAVLDEMFIHVFQQTSSMNGSITYTIQGEAQFTLNPIQFSQGGNTYNRLDQVGGYLSNDLPFAPSINTGSISSFLWGPNNVTPHGYAMAGDWPSSQHKNSSVLATIQLFNTAANVQVGDITGNGTIDDQDIVTLQDGLARSEADLAYDIDGDLYVNDEDLTFLVTSIIETAFGDSNLDAEVNFDDLLTIAQNYSVVSNGWAYGDFDRNGIVDFDDTLIVAQNYGFGADARGLQSKWERFVSDYSLVWHEGMPNLMQIRAAVPEPVSLFVVGSLVVSLQRRRRK